MPVRQPELPQQEVVILAQQPHAVQQPPLAIVAVALPSTLIEDRSNTTFYAVDVTPEGGQAPWRVFRRYNDFLDLSQNLAFLSPGLSFPGAPFPKKTLFKCANTALEARRGALETWLRRVLEHPHSRGSWSVSLRQFFEAGRQVLQAPPLAAAAAPQVGQTAASPPSAEAAAPPPTGSAPLLPPAPPQSAAPEAAPAEGQVLQIEIPAGVAAGQILGVTVPDGRELHLQVPESAVPGAQVELWFDSIAGTLQLVS